MEPGPIPVKITLERLVEQHRGDQCLGADYEKADLVVNAGLDWLNSFFSTSVESAMRYIAIGTSGSAAAAANTALGAEVMRGSAAYVKGTTGICNLWSEFAITATYALYECGILNSATGGTLYARDTYAVKNVVSGDTVRVSYSVQFSAA